MYLKAYYSLDKSMVIIYHLNMDEDLCTVVYNSTDCGEQVGDEEKISSPWSDAWRYDILTEGEYFLEQL